MRKVGFRIKITSRAKKFVPYTIADKCHVSFRQNKNDSRKVCLGKNIITIFWHLYIVCDTVIACERDQTLEMSAERVLDVRHEMWTNWAIPPNAIGEIEKYESISKWWQWLRWCEVIASRHVSCQSRTKWHFYKESYQLGIKANGDKAKMCNLYSLGWKRYTDRFNPLDGITLNANAAIIISVDSWWWKLVYAHREWKVWANIKWDFTIHRNPVRIVNAKAIRNCLIS